MRTIVSTIGTVSCGTLKYLVEVIQPTENKNKSVSYNSYTFIQEAKTWDWEIYQEEVQVSYEVANLYHSVPVNKAINVLIDTLNNKGHLKEHTY